MEELRPGILGTPGMFSEKLLNDIMEMEKNKTGTGIQGGQNWRQLFNIKGKGHVKKPTAKEKSFIAGLVQGLKIKPGPAPTWSLPHGEGQGPRPNPNIHDRKDYKGFPFQHLV